MTLPEVSIVVPAYMAEDTVGPALIDLVITLESMNLEYEVIVVIDGKVDRSKERVEALLLPKVRIFEYPKNMGKGYALRFGINLANGTNYIGFVDADLDISSNALSTAFRHLELNENTMIVVGSKLHPKSKVNYPPIRKIQSRIFAKFINLLFRFGINDTQTGLKLGRSKIMKEASSATVMNGFAFDLEFLMRAKRFGGSFASIPIDLKYKFGTTITPVKYLETIRDVLRVMRLYLWK